MAFDFPNSPTPGSVYSPAGGPSYTWDGQKWVMTGSALIPTPAYSNRNLIVNGAFQVFQENAAGSVGTTGNYYLADQWATSFNGPTGGTHINYTTAAASAAPTVQYGYGRMNCIAPYTSIVAANYAGIYQYLEGKRVLNLNWGSAFAIPAVLTFEARCAAAAIPCTYSVTLRSSGADQSIVFPVSFAAGETTWKKFTFAVPAITTGTFARDTTKGLDLWFVGMAGSNWLAPSSGAWLSGNYIALSGQSNVLAAASNMYDIRNVSLTADPTGSGIPPAWEMPDEAQELIACRRYWQNYSLMATGYNGAGAATFIPFGLNVIMRVSPTLAFANIVYTNSSGLTHQGTVLTPTSFVSRWLTTAAGSSTITFDMTATARM